MEWQQWGQRLKEILALKKSPVAVTYSDTAPADASGGKCRACSALSQATAGKVVALSAANSTCPGGSLYLGLRAQAPEQAKVLRDFLINGEKLFASPTAIQRANALAKVKPPLGMADYVVFSPLESAELKPDIAVFTCNAWQAARLINLAWFQNGLPMECDPTGSLCRSVITYPLITGKVNVSFGDITARKSERLAEDELFVTLPYEFLWSAFSSIEGCSAGAAKAEMPPAMRELTRRAGGEVPEL